MMKAFYTFAFVNLLVVMPLVTEAQVTPNQSICPGTTIQYNVTSGQFAGKTLNWTVVGGVFTNTNSTVSNDGTSVNIIKWNNNITSGSFTVRSPSDGGYQTFTFNVLPVTQPYFANNISAECGAGNIQTEVAIDLERVGEF